MRDIRIEFTNERIIPSGGLAVVGAILGKSDFVKKLNRMDVTKNRSQHQIKNGDILLTYIGMLCMGKPQFDAVREMEDNPEFYKYALGVAYKIPSEETLRQRMDDIGRTIRSKILQEKETIGLCKQITDEKLLFRLDSGNDAFENMGILLEAGCYFNIKHNLRREGKES